MMDTEYYLTRFQNSLNGLDKSLFDNQQLNLKVDVWLNSVVLKIQNPAWLNQVVTARAFSESVFFSVWVNDDTIRKGKIYYNIHALKLRELNRHQVKSRDFAKAFRERFKPYAAHWPNVSVNYGPLTLMEGWIVLDEHLEQNVKNLSIRFLDVAPIIDALLKETKK